MLGVLSFVTLSTIIMPRWLIGLDIGFRDALCLAQRVTLKALQFEGSLTRGSRKSCRGASMAPSPAYEPPQPEGLVRNIGDGSGVCSGSSRLVRR